MPIKDIAYLILAGMTIFCNISAVLYFAFSIRFKTQKLETDLGKISGYIHDDSGKFNLQTADDCKSCRKSCRDDICGFVKEELGKQYKTIERIHTRLDEQNRQLDEISIWMPKRKDD